MTTDPHVQSWPPWAIRLIRLWREREPAILNLAIGLAAIAASVWLAYQFWRLLWQAVPLGALDLGQRHSELTRWLAGVRIYGVDGSAVYPPASYMLFAPLIGWVEFTAARWIWAAVTIVSLVVLVRLTVRESRVTSARARTLVALIPLSMYATGAGIGNGQVTLPSLAALVAGLVLLCRGESTWSRDLMAAALILAALIKLSLIVPFIWIVVFVPRTLRPALLVGAGYVALSFAGAAFQEDGIVQLFKGWRAMAEQGTIYGAPRGGFANIHTALSRYSLDGFQAYASYIALGLLCPWTYLYRRGDPWLLIGFIAIVARFWTYHLWYDDLLILLPMIALTRICVRGMADWKACLPAGLLLVVSFPLMLAPGGLHTLPAPWNSYYVTVQATLWAAMALFLFWRLHLERRRMGSSA